MNVLALFLREGSILGFNLMREGALVALIISLVLDGWWDVWRSTAHWALLNGFNHFLIILKYANQIWSLKPFHFNNHWLSHINFNELVLNSCSTSFNQRMKASSFMGKLKCLKVSLKICNKQVFGILDY